jgi:molecular chaperone GrpE
MEQNKRLKERLLYAHAEMENTRRRAQLDVENERTYGIGKFGKSLLDVADSLSLALKHSPSGADASKVPPADLQNQLNQLHEGVVMTEKQLHKVLSQYGIKRFDSKLKKFDPAYHSALFEIPSVATSTLPNGPYEAGTVVEVLKEGFTIGDRILRPAEVGVVRKD